MELDEQKYNPWRAILTISKRELNRWIKKPIYFFCIIGAPAITAIFFLSLMAKGLPADMPIAVVDLNNTSTSRSLIRQLDAFSQTKVASVSMDFEYARTLMQKGKIYGVFYIPSNFSQDAIAGRQPKLSFYTNGSYLIAASLLFRDMKTVSVLGGKAIGLQTGLSKGQTTESIMGQLQPILIETHPIGNPWLNYSVYLSNTILPGMLELVILMTIAFAIGSEIKEGSAKEWLEISHNSILISLIGKLTPYFFLFTIVGLCLQLTLYGFLGFPLQSGWAAMILAMICFILSCMSCSIFMIGMLPTLRLGLSFACLFGMIGFSISGFTYPVSAMDPLLQSFSIFFPLRHYFLIYADQALNGRAFIYSIYQYIFLLSFCILPVFVLKRLKNALLTFRYIP